MAAKDLVLVTGGSGFIGSHTALVALREGYRVRTTVRSLTRADGVREMLTNGGASKEQVDEVEFTEADLSDDAGWSEACRDCKYVLHVASPFPLNQPKDEDELIKPARDGTLRVLKAAKEAGVKRVVVTSSLAAIGYGHPATGKTFTEEDWSDLSGSMPPYQKSKTIAERAAWDWHEKEGQGMEMSVVNPVGVLGPVLSKSAGTSIEIIMQMLQGKVPLLPKLTAGWVDVRDVADLHLLVMTAPEANGQRYLATSEMGSLKDLAVIVKAKFGAKASKVPTMEAPNMLMKVMSYIDPRLKLIADELDNVKRSSNEKARKAFGWQPRDLEEMTVAAAESCLKYGLA